MPEKKPKRLGFLSQAADEWAIEHMNRHASSFTLGETFIAFTLEYLSQQNRSTFATAELVPTLIFERSLHHYQAIYILTKNGMVAASRALARVLLECQFVLLAVLNDEETLGRYLDQLQLTRRKALNKLKSSTSQSLADLRNVASEINREEIDNLIKEGGIRPVGAAEFARKADLSEIYLTAYTLLSGAVHSTAFDLEDDVEFGPNKEIVGFRSGQRDDETVRQICLCGSLLAESLSELSKRASPNVSEDCEKFRDQFLEALSERAG